MVSSLLKGSRVAHTTRHSIHFNCRIFCSKANDHSSIIPPTNPAFVVMSTAQQLNHINSTQSSFKKHKLNLDMPKFRLRSSSHSIDTCDALIYCCPVVAWGAFNILCATNKFDFLNKCINLYIYVNIYA